MPIQQGEPIVPPQPSDPKLRDFSQIIQASMRTLFQAGHVHRVVTSLPTMRDGDVGDIYMIDIAGAKQIAMKFNDGWYAVTVTAI